MAEVVTKRRLFPIVLWSVAVICILYLVAWPLVASWWAGKYWEKVPCALTDHGFFYEYDGQAYVGFRKNFWMRDHTKSDKTISEAKLVPDGSICYVKPHDPEWAVENVDGLGTISSGSKGFAVCGLIIFVAIALQFRKSGA